MAGFQFPDGVKVWVECPDATIDICFVHGLTGDRDETWTALGQSAPWPKTLLAAKIPQARLLTYGYDAYVIRKSVVSTNTLLDHAANLLMDLTADRISCEATSRRIIFVAHSLGGLVCKEAMLQSRNNPEQHLRDLFDNTVGIVFMGTPHKGSWMADWAKIPVHALGLLKSTNKTLLDILHTDNQLLQSIQSKFLNMVRELRENGRLFEITCFFEELPLEGVGVIVTRESATFESYMISTIHANHSSMVKFQSSEDTGFKRVLGELKRWQATSRASLDTRQIGSSNLLGRENNIRDNELYHDCLKSLSFPQMNDRYNDIENPSPGTCLWITEHLLFEEWMACDKGLLWIKGKPGSGKSTLLRHIIHAVTASLGNTPLILTHFFHGRGVELQKTPLGFFRSLMHQLLCRVPDGIPKALAEYNTKHHTMGDAGSGWQWHLRELKDMFKDAVLDILNYHSIWLFVDALDESDKANAVRLANDFETWIRETPVGLKFHICFTCRHYPVLLVHQTFEVCIEHENGEDINTYTADKLGTIQCRIPPTIMQLIIDRASGVFIWTRLVIERIIELEREGMGWAEIAAAIDHIPNELDDLYGILLTSVTGSSASLKLIQWICFAVEPLSLLALQWAMAMDKNCSYRSFKEYQSDIVDDYTMEKRIQALSCGIIEVSHSSSAKVVQFIHQTAKDFIITRGLQFIDSTSNSVEVAIANAHYQLSRTCIWYLAMQEIGQLKSGGDYQAYLNIRTMRLSFAFGLNEHLKVESVSKMPLLEYSLSNWMFHENQSEEMRIAPDDLLENISELPTQVRESWGHIYEIIDRERGNIPSPELCVMYLASAFSLNRPLPRLLRMMDQDTFSIDDPDGFGWTPLSHAAMQGNQAMVEMLLKTGKVDADSRDENGRTPLSYAAERGFHTVAYLLLDKGKATPDTRDTTGDTPLAHAAQGGHAAIVQLLLDTGEVEVNSQNGNRQSPLLHATMNGHEATVRLLLSTEKADINSRDVFGRTSLAYAAEHGLEAIVQLLIGIKNVEIDSRDNRGQTPLSYAAMNGHEATVRLLLDIGRANVNSRDHKGQTPLAHAAGSDHEAIVKLLLNPKVEINSPDDLGQTLSAHTSMRGYEATVKPLRNPGKAEVNSRDTYGKVPLSGAISQLYEALAQLLRRAGGINTDLEE
ncbi:nb-arc and ankyrin domain-containing protein [Nemania sp. FL0916]|nr:nb-arc and ankyrin domain-containing protein [Nemania sp. FL0916]